MATFLLKCKKINTKFERVPDFFFDNIGLKIDP